MLHSFCPPACPSAIDKLDKEPWAAVREEMVAEKGLPGPVADKIGTLVQVRGTMGGKGGLHRRREERAYVI